MGNNSKPAIAEAIMGLAKIDQVSPNQYLAVSDIKTLSAHPAKDALNVFDAANRGLPDFLGTPLRPWQGPLACWIPLVGLTW